MSTLREVKKPVGVKTKKIVLSLPCILTKEEQRLKGLEMATKDHELFKKQEEAAIAKEKFKKEAEAISGAITTLARVLRDGYEHRSIECKEIHDYNTGTVQIVRTDNGAVHEERAMTDHERQTTFIAEEDEAANEERKKTLQKAQRIQDAPTVNA